MLNVHKVKQDICEIGRRIYNKGFAAANDGTSRSGSETTKSLHAHHALQRFSEAG